MKKTYQQLIVWASGFYLTDSLPVDYDEMEDNDINEHLEVHAYEPFEGAPAASIWEEIENLALNTQTLIEEELKPDPDTMAIVWSIQDVHHKATESEVDLTDEEARGILATMDRCHDACHGICWDTIDVYIDDVIRERPEKIREGITIPEGYTTRIADAKGCRPCCFYNGGKGCEYPLEVAPICGEAKIVFIEIAGER